MNSKVSPRLSESTATEICDAVYGPRLARDFPACFEPLCDVNEAHLLMLATQRLLPEDAAVALARSLRSIRAQGVAAVPLDPALEDAYLNFEAHLMRHAGSHVGGCLHVARSRNDILATMDRLRCRRVVLDLVDALCAARAAALERAALHADVVMPGYTHLQPAQPITFGFYMLAVADVLGRDVDRLLRIEPALDESPLGACALAGTSFAIDRQQTARWLGFAGVVPNTLDAVASRDYALELLGAMALMATNASRVAQDFYVWATPEFGLLSFPDSVAGTSSIMPQKKNHIVLEYLKGKAGQLGGALAAAVSTVRAVHFTHTGDGNRESMRNLWDAADESLRVAAMLRLVLESAIPQPERMLKAASANFSTATDLADLLVRRCGLSFRESHHVVGATVRAALADGLDSGNVTPEMLDRAALDVLGRPLRLDKSALSDSLDPTRSVGARDIQGGPNATQVRARSAQGCIEVGATRQANGLRRARFEESALRRREALAALAESAKVPAC